MKIYINHFNLSIIKDILPKFDKQYVYSENYLQVYTDQGIFKVEKGNIYSLTPVDKIIQIYENYYDNMDMIIDFSYFKLTKSTSIYGNKHISASVKRNIYKLNKNSRVKLIIEIVDNVTTENYNQYDIYFEIDNEHNVNELFIKCDIIEFLTILN